MTIQNFVRSAFGIAAGVAFLASCSANGTTPSRGDSGTLVSALGKGVIPMTQHPIAHSWRHKPPKGTTGTIWADDVEYGSVDMIAYPSGTLVGQVSGFYFPWGNCSDKSGNVYVADFESGIGYEINSAGSVVNSWSHLGIVIGCSVAPNGDVAFTSVYPGVVIIVAGPDAGASYPGPDNCNDSPAGYDAAGNLFVECQYQYDYSVNLYEWPAGGSSWQHLNVNHTISRATAVQNMGKYLGIGDEDVNGDFFAGIYLATVSGSQVTVVTTIVFSCGSGCSAGIHGSWGSINNKPNGVVTTKVKDIALTSATGFRTNAIAIFKAKNGHFLKSIVAEPDEDDYGVTFTKP